MIATRILAALVALLLAVPATAANVEERSPFRQGHWWNPAKSGHGFELLNAGGQVFVVWYTYDAVGKPTWYTAQGAQETLGQDWQLQKHHWAGGRIDRSTTVGSLRLTRMNAESLQVGWTVGGTPGTWPIEPFVAAAMMNEVDLSGHWYDRARSGWGMTIVDQGDVLGAVVYAYDPAGDPTWVAGFDRGKGTRVDLYATRGTCPGCAYAPTTSQAAGSIAVEYRGDTEVVVRGAPAVALAADLSIEGALVHQLGRPASTRPADFQLANFGSEKALKDFLAEGMPNRRFHPGGSDFSASPPMAPPVFSATNLQDSGVDEADLVKSDGRYVYTYAATPPGVARPAIRVAYVGGDGSALEVRGEVALPAFSNASHQGLFLHGGNLVSLMGGALLGWNYNAPVGIETHVDVLSLADPSVPALRWSAVLSGGLVSSRRVGDRLYVVTRFTPTVPGYLSYTPTDVERAANRALLEGTPLASLLPKVSVNGAPAVPSLSISAIHAPPPGSRTTVADMVVVTAIDLGSPAVVQSLAIAGTTDALYVSPGNLYVASSRYEMRGSLGTLLPTQPAVQVTDIHQVSIGAGNMRVVASAPIEGTVGYDIDKAAFRFGEHQGRLGVVTSAQAGMWGGENRNRLTILEPSTLTPGLLKTVSWLPNARRPEALGKPNELLYGTRFVDDRLYAVTFKKTDPLYVVDLADASDPRIAGQLEIPGFSDYLHPLPNGLLLGFGKDARPAGGPADGQWAWYQGLHLTLFDVSNPSAPREIQRVLMGKRGSDSALFAHHHAFSALALPGGSTAIAIPAAIHEGPMPQWGSGDSATYPWQYSGLLRFEVRGTTPANASLVQRETLVTHSVANPQPAAADMAAASARSVLFPDAAIYVGAGKMWRQDAAGSVFGPY